MTVGASDILDLANTWTGGTTFSGITENITNTNSSGASRLLDLQAGISGGVSVMSVDTNGITTASQLITGSGVSNRAAIFVRSLRMLERRGSRNLH
jgi:hypothetical protein